MRQLAISVGAAACAVLGQAGAARAGPVEASLCTFGPSATSIGLAKVVGAPKVFLKNCPPGDAGCTEPGHTPYVIPGDTVVVGARAGNAVCVAMPNRQGDTAGWVAGSQVQPLPTPPAPPAAWVGHWTQYGGDSIDLTLKGGALVVSGAACWPACNASGKGRVPNVGDLDGKATPAGNRLRIGSDDDCAAEMWLVGSYLVVFDNMGCGGMNVSFNGVYQRAARR
ncbi:MAG TPA: hypothetical protein VN694_14560 [Caulobacteraceae bacterium]|nr:hypothetical protein [Caulobacteraceae bacterium]